MCQDKKFMKGTHYNRIMMSYFVWFQYILSFIKRKIKDTKNKGGERQNLMCNRILHAQKYQHKKKSKRNCIFNTKTYTWRHTHKGIYFYFHFCSCFFRETRKVFPWTGVWVECMLCHFFFVKNECVVAMGKLIFFYHFFA